MRTLWLASPGPAGAPPPDSACGPAVAGSEGLPCPAPGGCGSLLFGPSDPLTTGVTCGVLAGFARGRESALCLRPSVTKAARRCAGLGPARPLPRPPPVVTPASPSPPASPPTFPPFPHFLGGAGGTLERKSGNRSFKASPVMSERWPPAHVWRLAGSTRHLGYGLSSAAEFLGEPRGPAPARRPCRDERQPGRPPRRVPAGRFQKPSALPSTSRPSPPAPPLPSPRGPLAVSGGRENFPAPRNPQNLLLFKEGGWGRRAPGPGIRASRSRWPVSARRVRRHGPLASRWR